MVIMVIELLFDKTIEMGEMDHLSISKDSNYASIHEITRNG